MYLHLECSQSFGIDTLRVTHYMKAAKGETVRAEVRIHFEKNELGIVQKALSVADRSAIHVEEEHLKAIGISIHERITQEGTGRLFSEDRCPPEGYSQNQLNGSIEVLGAIKRCLAFRIESPGTFSRGGSQGLLEVRNQALRDNGIVSEAMHLINNARQAILYAA